MFDFVTYHPDPDDWKTYPSSDSILWDLWGVVGMTEQRQAEIIREAGFEPDERPQAGVLTAEWRSPVAEHRRGSLIIAPSTNIHTCPKFAVSKKLLEEQSGRADVSRSLRDFVLSVRIGARQLSPVATSDSPTLNSDAIERLLRGATLWLTPKAVEGFNPADFDFLPTRERQTLSESVKQFREIARGVPSTEPATPSQIDQALTPFLRIVEVVRPDRYADPEALIIGKRVEQQLAGQLPKSVHELRFETGEDASGDPALWIWVILRDEAAKREDEFRSHVKAVRTLLEETVSQLGLGRWPYVRFRTVSELEPQPKKRTKR